MANAKVNGLSCVGAFLGHDVAAGLHFLHKSLIDVSLHHTVAQFLSGRPQFLFRLASAGNAQSGLSTSIAREGDGDAVARNGKALVAAQFLSHDLAVRNLDSNCVVARYGGSFAK